MSEVKIDYINPFIESTIDSMKTMVNTECERVGLYVKKDKQTLMVGDVSVMLSTFGALVGTVVISFPRKTSIRLVSSMLMDDDIDDFNDDVFDGVGEIGNLVVGSAKSAIAQKFGKDTQLSIPTTLVGKPHELQHQKGIPCIGCVFNTPHGKFALEVAVKEG